MRAFAASAFILPVALALVPSQLPAMNMPVYDLDSKVYLSTDIVLVQISMDEAKHKIATVQETLLGTLPIGTRLDQIDGYLSYFAKINSGSRLILFLDSRPRKLDFLYKEFEKAPYSIVPSGVELVDPFGHVHPYYQPMNPGGYFPEGYPWFPTDKPLTVDDARKFPTLSEEKQKIIEAIHSVEPARIILGHESTAEDVPRLLHFVDATSSDTSDCAIRTASAIKEDAIQHIKHRNDPDLLLRAETIASEMKSQSSAEDFFGPTPDVIRSQDATKTFRTQRAEFLLNALADKNRPMEIRRTALYFLLYKSAWGHPYSGTAKVLPIDDPELASIASRIVDVSRSIFFDSDDDAVLRGMCLRFLDLDEPRNVALAKTVYKAAKSDALRFEIEDVLLSKSDRLFLELEPPSSEAASIIGIEPRSGCAPAAWPGPLFIGLYRKHGYQNQAHRPKTEAERSTVLIDRRTGKTFEVKDAGYSSSSDGSGDGEFLVENLEGIPTGEYSIEIQFRRSGKVIGHGYGLKVSVIEESGRKRIVLDPEASREHPQLAFF
ncbi:MAG: hypothetical protein ABSE51_21275 [Terracidiphilus sp.]|jgi:hypothetical protein